MIKEYDILMQTNVSFKQNTLPYHVYRVIIKNATQAVKKKKSSKSTTIKIENIHTQKYD